MSLATIIDRLSRFHPNAYHMGCVTRERTARKNRQIQSVSDYVGTLLLTLNCSVSKNPAHGIEHEHEIARINEKSAI